MKKYPVTYKGKQYEVRWEQTMCEDYISIYEVIESKILWKTFKTYECVYSIPEEKVEKILFYKDDYNYYIEEIKKLFYLWECEKEREKKEELRKQEEEKIEANKQKSLDEWDGVIDE